MLLDERKSNNIIKNAKLIVNFSTHPKQGNLMSSHLSPTQRAILDLISKRFGFNVTQRIGSLQSVLQFIDTTLDEAHAVATLDGQPETAPIWQHIINELTLGETYFFRNQTQFKLLRTNILPDIIERNRHQRSLMIWSAGCATGEEAYSVAITLLHSYPELSEWQLSIIGTDLSQLAIETAQAGAYRAWSFRHQTPDLLESYFTHTPEGYQVSADIKKRVTFRQGNLLKQPPQSWADLVLCRNVLLYLTAEARQQVEAHLHHALKHGGWLLLGHAEALPPPQHAWTTHLYPGTILYQKTPHTGKLTYPTAPTAKQTGPLKAAPSHDIHQQCDIAAHAYQQKAYAQAEHILTALVKAHPTYTRANILLAAVLASRQAYDDARAQLDSALLLAPLSADAHYMMAIIQLEQRQPHAAEKSLKAALYSTPHHPLAAFLLGSQHAKMGDSARAQKLWKGALEHLHGQAAYQPLSDLTHHTAHSFRQLLTQSINGLAD